MGGGKGLFGFGLREWEREMGNKYVTKIREKKGRKRRKEVRGR